MLKHNVLWIMQISNKKKTNSQNQKKCSDFIQYYGTGSIESGRTK